MVISDIPDILVELYLIIPGVVSILILWKLAEKIIPDYENNIAIIFLMVVLASTSSLWLIVVGSTFNDSLSCAITLGALLFLLNSQEKGWKYLLFAGVLSGLAVGIKLTNGIYVPVIFIICFFLKEKEKFNSKLNEMFVLLLGVAFGFLASHGYWSWKLWSEFGNPFFPFFNSIFKSIEFLPENLQDRRFMGDYWVGALTLPFKMSMLQSWIYSEASAPEIKMAIALLLMPVIIIYTIRVHENIYSQYNIPYLMHIISSQ